MNVVVLSSFQNKQGHYLVRVDEWEARFDDLREAGLAFFLSLEVCGVGVGHFRHYQRRIGPLVTISAVIA